MLFLLLLNTYVIAQQVDTTKIENIKEIQGVIDSLSKLIVKLDTELQQIKKNMITGNRNSDEIIDLLTDEEDESMPEDQRSKKKRVDELLRAIEQRPGVLRFNGGATVSFQNGLQNINNKTNSVGSFDIYALTSFGPGTLLFFDLEAIGGNGIDEFVPTFSGLNGDAGSQQDQDGIDRLNLVEAWAEFTIFDELFTITAGKIDLTNYFDNNDLANDETLQFLSNSFVNSNALVAPGNSPGLRFRTSFLKKFYLQFGIVNILNSGSNIFGNIYKIGGLGFRILPETDWEANFRVYGYQHPDADNALGYGISFDETIFGEYKVFARYGKNSEKISDKFEITSAWSAGLSFIKQFGNKGINLGFAFGETYPNNSLLKTEKLIEIYARYQFNKWVYLSPHYQMVWNSLGLDNNYSVVGVRTHFNF